MRLRRVSSLIDPNRFNSPSQESRLGEKSIINPLANVLTQVHIYVEAIENIGSCQGVPRNLFVFAFPRLYLQRRIVHLVHIACGLHIR